MLSRNIAKCVYALALLKSICESKLNEGKSFESNGKGERSIEGRRTYRKNNDKRKRAKESHRRRKIEENEEFYCPAERYIMWQNLTGTVDAEFLAASQIELQYTEEYWNKFNSPIEEMCWNSLYNDMITAAMTMGYDDARWDCCINHYRDYDYDDLENEDSPPLKVAVNILGWDKASWEDEASRLPESEKDDWEDLTALEQAAADYLCYDENSWNEKSLPWSFDDTASPPVDIDFSCPAVRYQAWSQLKTQQKYAALDLGYTQYSWNNYDAEVELLSFEEVTKESDWNQAVLDLGYDTDTWDCCINNYMSYTYKDLQNHQSTFPFLEYSVNVLGWTKESWGSEDPKKWPDSEFKEWDQLIDFEKTAADYLCYYKESWDGVDSITEIGIKEGIDEIEEDINEDEEDKQ